MKFFFRVSLFFSFLFLSACMNLTHYDVVDQKVKPSASVQGVAAGAVGGAAVGAVLGNVAMPTVAGGVVGGVMGASLTQAWGAREYIARAGGKVVQVGEEVTVYIPNDVLFAEPACSRLSLCSYPLLDQVAVLLKTFNPGAPMMLTGHTDDVGGSQYKCRLSDKQAHAVAAYLWTQGVPLQQLKVISAGDSDPIASNRNIRGSAANRHIQIDIRPTQCS